MSKKSKAKRSKAKKSKRQNLKASDSEDHNSSGQSTEALDSEGSASTVDDSKDQHSEDDASRNQSLEDQNTSVKKSNDVSFTGSLSSDIVLLSSFLDGGQDRYYGKSRRDSCDLVSYVSTLLTIDGGSGTAARPTEANAVIGSFEASSVQCLVFTERPGSKLNKFQLIPIKSNREVGEKVLREWKSLPRQVDLDVHIQDVSNIIRHLESAQEHNRTDLIQFQFLVLYRAFRMLGKRVLDFSSHWEKLPFELMKTYADDISENPALTKTFVLFLYKAQYSFLSKFKLEGEKLTDGTDGESDWLCRYKYTVNASTLALWGDYFIGLWDALKEELLVSECSPESTSPESQSRDTPKTMQPAPPDPEKIPKVYHLLRTLFVTRPVWKHILSMRNNWILVCALEAVERNERKDPSGGLSGSNSAFAQDSDGVDDSCNVSPELFKESYEDAGDRVIRALDRVLAWYKAPLSIWSRFQRPFVGKHFKIYQVYYNSPHTVDFSPEMIKKVLHKARSRSKWVPSDSDIKRIQKNALRVSIHAGAAVIGWILSSNTEPESESVPSVFLNMSQVDSIPIGASQKCCHTCRMLDDIVDRRAWSHPTPGPKLVLPGFHDTFYAWSPPPGIPDDILLQLRRDLLDAAGEKVYSLSTKMVTMDIFNLPIE
ncbi:hypothetical protein GYMLUDRAFT_255390 [Collybiopsis luxurians FD-317 M1]|nr:hypothetical protein GYMLUDRAFT_255390 [Collybiopsis luxurians FD-317 M1]